MCVVIPGREWKKEIGSDEEKTPAQGNHRLTQLLTDHEYADSGVG